MTGLSARPRSSVERRLANRHLAAGVIAEIDVKFAALHLIGTLLGKLDPFGLVSLVDHPLSGFPGQPDVGVVHFRRKIDAIDGIGQFLDRHGAVVDAADAVENLP